MRVKAKVKRNTELLLAQPTGAGLRLRGCAITLHTQAGKSVIIITLLSKIFNHCIAHPAALRTAVLCPSDSTASHVKTPDKELQPSEKAY